MPAVRGAAAPQPTTYPPLRVLILNWRDITHPRAGGAEKVTHEIARRWVMWGHHVTQFAASYPGAAPVESVDGITIVRRGRQHTVHWEAFKYYRGQGRRRFDLVIDEVNTIPFMTPLYVSQPVVMFIHQLARNVWHFEAPFPLSTAGFLAEPLYLQPYRQTPIVTVSQSTARDLRRLGLHGPCYIIPEAIDTVGPEALPPLTTKEPHLTLAFVGRVVPSKRVDHIVRALALVRQTGIREACLWIVGSWDETYRRELDRLIDGLGLRGYVTFFGRVDDDTKESLLARAHLLVMTSVREGWGLVVTEANILGTPAVVYDVPGLRDSTHSGETGLVCHGQHPAALVPAIRKMYDDAALYARLRERAWMAAKALNWDRTARAAWDAVAPSLPPSLLPTAQRIGSQHLA